MSVIGLSIVRNVPSGGGDVKVGGSCACVEAKGKW